MAQSKAEAIELLHHCGDEIIEVNGKPLRDYGWELVDVPTPPIGNAAIIIRPFREKFDMQVFDTTNIFNNRFKIAGVEFKVVQLQTRGRQGWTFILV